MLIAKADLVYTVSPCTLRDRQAVAGLTAAINKAPMKRYYAEFIGTFCIVFCGTGAVVTDTVTHGAVGHTGIALTFGLIVCAMIYALGDVSGTHLNPAVTIGFTLAGLFPKKEVIPYLISQTAGALSASAMLYVIFPFGGNLGATLPAGSNLQSFLLELIMTSILMLVIVSVATGAKEKGIMAGIAIGGVVALEAAFGGPVSGASMNPARSLAPAVVSGQFQGLWIYLTAPFLGALLGTGAHKIINTSE